MEMLDGIVVALGRGADQDGAAFERNERRCQAASLWSTAQR